MTIEKTELRDVALSVLLPYPNNPRKNDEAVEYVANSLKEFGLVKNSIVVDENMVLLTGHTTLKAIRKLGWQSVPQVTQVKGLTDAQKKKHIGLLTTKAARYQNGMQTYCCKNLWNLKTLTSRSSASIRFLT